MQGAGGEKKRVRKYRNEGEKKRERVREKSPEHGTERERERKGIEKRGKGNV